MGHNYADGYYTKMVVPFSLTFGTFGETKQNIDVE